MSMLREEIRQVVKVSVMETLGHLGFTVNDPNAVQKDMIHLRKLRLGQEELALWMRRSAVGVAVTGALYVFWDALLGLVSKQ